MDLVRSLTTAGTFAVGRAGHLAQPGARAVRRRVRTLRRARALRRDAGAVRIANLPRVAAGDAIEPEARALGWRVATHGRVVLRAAHCRETNDQNRNSNVHGLAIGPPPLRLSS